MSLIKDMFANNPQAGTYLRGHKSNTADGRITMGDEALLGTPHQLFPLSFEQATGRKPEGKVTMHRRNPKTTSLAG